MNFRCSGVLAAFLFLPACSMEHTELARIGSPDGHTVALLEWEGGGGAAGSTVVQLYLIEAANPKDLGKPVLEATNCGDMSVAWTDKRTLQVHYSATCRIGQFTNKWFSDTMPQSARSDESSVELILARVGLPQRDTAQK